MSLLCEILYHIVRKGANIDNGLYDATWHHPKGVKTALAACTCRLYLGDY
jgi:hypothetical protein